MPKTTFVMEKWDYSNLDAREAPAQLCPSHINTDNNRQTAQISSTMQSHKPPKPNPREMLCLEEGGEDGTSQAKAQEGLHHSSGSGRWCCAPAGRRLGSSSSSSCCSGCPSLCDGTGTSCRCLGSSSRDGGVYNCRRNHHGGRGHGGRGQGGKRNLDQGRVHAGWDGGSNSHNGWLSGDGLRLRCCRSGHGQRLRGDDCRLAGDDAQGVGLREEREKHNELAQTSKDSVFCCCWISSPSATKLGSMWGGWVMMVERSYHLTESHGGKRNGEDDGRTHLCLFSLVGYWILNLWGRGMRSSFWTRGGKASFAIETTVCVCVCVCVSEGIERREWTRHRVIKG